MPQAIRRNTFILLTLLSLYIGVTVHGGSRSSAFEEEPFSIPKEQANDIIREKRGAHKAGFFKTLFSVIGEQYTDTKDTFSKVGNMINDNFLPENAPVTEATTPSSDPNATTTEAPYKIKRSEFNKIISRNLRGLVRLFNIELKDALKQSRITEAEHKKNVSKEVSKFL